MTFHGDSQCFEFLVFFVCFSALNWAVADNVHLDDVHPQMTVGCADQLLTCFVFVN